MSRWDSAPLRAMPATAWAFVRAVVLIAVAVACVALGPSGAEALEPIVVDARTDRIEITNRGEIWDNRGDSLQVETAAGLDGVVGRMDVKAVTPGTNPNWIVFALTNRTDRHLEHWLTAERYNHVGSGGVWPDLDASRIAAVTPSIGFVPERVQSDRADVFRITLEPGQTITFVAELSSERFSRLFLWKPLAYELKVRERQLFNGTLLGLTGLMAIFLTAIFAANHKAIFPTAALVAWCVLAYLCVDFGFFHKLFNLRPEDNAVYRAAGEASIAASLVIFLYTFLRLRLGHGLVQMLFGVWMLAQLALIAVAVIDPRLAATFARLSFLLIGGAGAAFILFLAIRGQDRAMSLIPTWMLFLVWVFATAVTLTGRMSGDIVVAGLAAGLVLVVVLIGFTVTQFAFRSLEPAYGAAPDEQQLRALAVDGVGAATWEWSARRDEIKVSPVLEAQLGLNHGELSTKVDDFLQHMHSSDRDRFRMVLWSIQERAGGRIRVEFRLRRSDNQHRWFELEAASVPSADRRNVRCVGLLRDITDTKFAHERLVEDAVLCRITGLPNREIFLDRLSVASERAKVEGDIRPTIIFIDLDRFSSINKTLGIQVADSLLLTIARRLKRHLERYDTLARIGGDKFAMLLLHSQDPRELAGLAERVRRSLRSPISIAGQEIVLTGSLGIAVYEGDGSPPEELLKGAEIAMYRAKRQGADRIEIYQPAMRNESVGLPQEEQELRKAVEQGALQVHYQPIVYLPTEELAGFEAVLHWQHPRLKTVGHSYVMEVAEKSDLIRNVGNLLLKQALEAVKSWQTLLPRTEAPLFVSVSLSNSQMFKLPLIDEWRQVIDVGNVPAECIRLEVSEALVMENPERAVEMMRLLSAGGAEIVLDEFGAGYSSVVYLQRFPVSTIKVDKAIVHAGTAGEGEGGSVVRSIAALAHELGKKVLAEGVEIEEDVVFLRAIGCEYGQGLYYGEPMSPAEVADLVSIIAKSERKLEAPGLFRTRPKKSKARPKTAERKSPRRDAGHGKEAEKEAVFAKSRAEDGHMRPEGWPATSRKTSPSPEAAEPPSGAKSSRPNAGEAIKDVRRVIASLPNVTVRPIERTQRPETAEDGAAGKTQPGHQSQAVPPPLSAKGAVSRPTGDGAKVSELAKPPPMPLSPVVNAAPHSVQAKLGGAAGPAALKPEESEPTLRISSLPPAQVKPPGVTPPLPATPTHSAASERSAFQSQDPLQPSVMRGFPPSHPPRPNGGAKPWDHANRGNGSAPPPGRTAPGEKTGAATPNGGQPTGGYRSSEPPRTGPQSMSGRAPEKPREEALHSPPVPPPVGRPGLDVVARTQPPTQPGPEQGLGARGGAAPAIDGTNGEPPVPVNGGLPPHEGSGEVAYSHLPPGIAKSLERLAGKTAKRPGGGAGRVAHPPARKRESG